MNCPSIEIRPFEKIPKEVGDIVELAENQLGEIGVIGIEDDCSISFEVYRDSYEDAPKAMKSKDGKVYLKLIDKFDDPSYVLIYKIIKGCLK